MQIRLSLALLLSSLLSGSIAIPQPIQKRAPYSVVPVDGGAAAAASTGGLPPPITIIFTETITQKSPPATITIIDVQQHSEVTKTVTESQSGDVQQEKETVYVTVEHIPTGINQGGPPVIYVPTTIVETVLVTLPAETITLGASTMSTSAASLSSSTSSSTSLQSSTSTSSASLSSTTTTLTSETQTTETTTSSMSTSTSHDNGLWKTTYPIWSNSTAPTPAPQRVRL